MATYLTTSMVYRLLDDPATAHGVPGLEAVSYGDSPVHPERLREAVTRWGGRWRQGYGTNEAAVICRLSPADHDAAVAGRPELLASVGRPVAGVEVQVRDARGAPVAAGRTGEVWMRSAAMMTGYWGGPNRRRRSCGTAGSGRGTSGTSGPTVTCSWTTGSTTW